MKEDTRPGQRYAKPIEVSLTGHSCNAKLGIKEINLACKGWLERRGLHSPGEQFGGMRRRRVGLEGGVA